MGDTNLAACSALQVFTPICNVLTPGFTTITNTLSQAECFCYNQGTWSPNLYDGYADSCLSYVSTASPTIFQSIASANGGRVPTAPCRDLGDFKTTTDATNPGRLACASVDGHFYSCNSKTPGFNTLTDATLLAACLCYSDKVWQPDSYDSPWTSCAYYLSTADPAAYSTFVENSDHHVQTAPCRDLGDILGSTTPATPGPTPSIGPIQSNSVSSFSNTASQTSDTGTQPTPTITPAPHLPSFFLGSGTTTQSGISPTILFNTDNPITNPSCSSVQDILGSCLIRSPELSTITDFRTAASCLCYSGIVWQPSKYDSIWGGCASYLSTAFPADYSIAVKTNSVSFAAPCKFVGDILAGSKTTSGGSGALKTSGPATVTQTVTAGSGAERIAVVEFLGATVICISITFVALF